MVSMKLRRENVIPLAVCFLVAIAPVALAIRSYARVMEMPIQKDVLILQIGEDDAVDIATREIEEAFSRRNKAVLERAMDTLARPMFDYATWYIIAPSPRAILKTEIVGISLNELESTASEYRARLIVVVGHGTEDGMQDEYDAASWFEVAEGVSAAKPYASIFTSCYGSKGAELLDRSFGFAGVVDAIASARLASAIALAAFDGRTSSHVVDAAKSAMDRGNQIMTGAVAPRFLIPVPEWWLLMKIGLTIVLTAAYYIIAPATAPKTWTELAYLLGGAALIAIFIYLFTATLCWLIDVAIIPWVTADLVVALQALKNFTGVIASYLGGLIAVWINGGTPHPNFFTWLSQARTVKAGQAASESATAADPNPLTRGMFALTTAILAVTFIDIIVILVCSLIPDSQPPADDDPPPNDDPPPSGGGGRPGVSPF